MNEAFHLSRLQKIDTQLDNLEHRLAEIERILADDQSVHQAEETERSAAERVEQARKVLRGAEEAVKSVRLKMDLNESALYGGKVRSPKELQDLQNEAAALKRHLAVLEDQQLEAMMALDEIEQEQQSAYRGLDQAKATFATQSASIRGEQTRLLREKERLQAERGPIINQVTPAIIGNYERLRKQKRGLAVANVDEGTCLACGSTLTPADWQAARSPHLITYCSSCGRILYAG